MQGQRWLGLGVTASPPPMGEGSKGRPRSFLGGGKCAQPGTTEARWYPVSWPSDGEPHAHRPPLPPGAEPAERGHPVTGGTKALGLVWGWGGLQTLAHRCPQQEPLRAVQPPPGASESERGERRENSEVPLLEPALWGRKSRWFPASPECRLYHCSDLGDLVQEISPHPKSSVYSHAKGE